jgi:CRP-like cAMP-binding protein
MAITRVEGWLLERAAFEALLAERPGLIHRLEIPPDVEARLRAPRFPGWSLTSRCWRPSIATGSA